MNLIQVTEENAIGNFTFSLPENKDYRRWFGRKIMNRKNRAVMELIGFSFQNSDAEGNPVNNYTGYKLRTIPKSGRKGRFQIISFDKADFCLVS
jgi:hypothetical protein